MLKDKTKIPCDGWWDEKGWGRQPMLDLTLQFESGRISGSGYDIVGLFTFNGTITGQGHVAMVKHYLGQHTVDYVGSYDGEGLLWGQWHIGTLSDQWMIRIKGSKAAMEAAAIEEIAYAVTKSCNQQGRIPRSNSPILSFSSALGVGRPRHLESEIQTISLCRKACGAD